MISGAIDTEIAMARLCFGGFSVIDLHPTTGLTAIFLSPGACKRLRLAPSATLRTSLFGSLFTCAGADYFIVTVPSISLYTLHRKDELVWQTE
jgi:hypothetical protein